MDTDLLTMDGTSAIVMTDLVGSTALNARLGDVAMAALWREHDRCARDAIRLWNGQEIGRSDGFIAAFERIDAAVGFAKAYHRALDRLHVRLAARASIHVGPVTLRRNDPGDVARGATPFELDGLVLPIAARLLELASGGQTLLTGAAAQALEHAEPLLSFCGHYRVKGMPDPLEVHQLVEAGSPPLAPPEDSPKVHAVVWRNDGWFSTKALPNSLPAERGTFVGRRHQIAHLGERFDHAAGLVTLTGMGGVGKTRLSLRFARAWLGSFPGGAWFCDLSGASSEDDIVRAVAQGLDLSLGQRVNVSSLGDAIAGRGRCLLIIDNFEQLTSHAEATVGQWVGAAPDACILVTSRSVLGIRGEQVVLVDPLDDDEAVDLFKLRAASIVGDRFIDDDGAARDLVKVLDCLPLAIELAAARVRLLSPTAMLGRMNDRFSLLARSGNRSGRQSTLRSTLDWSWELLTQGEQQALAQLSVFDGGFTLESIESIVQLDGLGADIWQGDLVQAMLDKSLLVSQQSGRFDLLRSVRDYAAERLQAGPGQAARRHWEYFAALPEEHAMSGRFMDASNVISACRRATAHGDATSASRALTVAAAALQMTGPASLVLALADAVLTMESLTSAQRAASLRVKANAHYALGQRRQASASCAEGLQLARRAGDAAMLVRLCCAAAEPLMRAGDVDAARALLSEAFDLAERGEEDLLRVAVRNSLGTLAMSQGRLDEATTQFEAALPLARRGGHRRLEGGLLGNLGGVTYLLGAPDAALKHYRDSLAIANEIGDRQWAANARCNLGLILFEAGDVTTASEELSAAIRTAQEIGQTLLEATALCNLGLLKLHVKDPGEAIGPLERSAELAGRVGDLRLATQALRALGNACADQGEPARAIDASRRSVQHAEAAGDRAECAKSTLALARHCLAAGQADEGSRWLEQARAALDAVAADARAGLAAEIDALTRG